MAVVTETPIDVMADGERSIWNGVGFLRQSNFLFLAASVPLRPCINMQTDNGSGDFVLLLLLAFMTWRGPHFDALLRLA